MADMTPQRLLFWSLIALALSVCGFFGIIFLSFAFFTYQGNGMDWIYPTGGLFVFIALGSAFTAVVSGIKTAREEREHNRDSD
jgi:hypothetical protein